MCAEDSGAAILTSLRPGVHTFPSCPATQPVESCSVPSIRRSDPSETTATWSAHRPDLKLGYHTLESGVKDTTPPPPLPTTHVLWGGPLGSMSLMGAADWPSLGHLPGGYLAGKSRALRHGVAPIAVPTAPHRVATKSSRLNPIIGDLPPSRAVPAVWTYLMLESSLEICPEIAPNGS